MAVQYDKEKGFTTWLDLLKKEIANVSSEINTLFDNVVSKMTDTQWKQIWKDENGWDNFITKNKIADENFKEFTSTVGNAKFTLEDYQQWLIQNGKATSTFTSFTKKAGSVLKSFGATLASIGINWAISEIISIAIKGFDNLIHAVDNAKEALDDSVSSFDSVTNEVKSLEDEIKSCGERIAELQKLSDNGTISISDQQELELLKQTNDELERKLALKQAEQILAQKEVLDDNEKLLNTKVRSSYSKSDVNVGRGIGGVANSILPEEELSLAIDEYEKLLQRLSSEELSEGTRKTLQTQMEYASSRIKEMYDIISPSIDAYDKLIEAGYNLNSEEKANYDLLKQREDEYLLFNYTVNKTKEAFQGLNNEQKQNVLLNRLVAQGLSDMQAQSILGNISEEDNNNLWDKDFSFVPPDIKDYSSAEEYGKAYAEAWINGVSEPIESAEPLIFDFSTYEDQIDDIQSSITTLRSALDLFNAGTLDESTIIDLMQQFPELVPYIDLTADGFGNLSEGLSALIAQQPGNLISELEKLKSSLTTDEECEQVDLLIDQLQRLSSYGDSGIEAYATTIGSTWTDTANVVDGVITQFENLAKVQETVADGMTISANAAAELARMYPEILDQAQVTAAGQITLNEEVVNSILDGDKAIVDAQIKKLEADKAELTAKRDYAEAQLNIAKQVGEGEGSITREVAQYRLDIANQLLQSLIEAGMEEDRAYAAVAESMAGNMDEYNRIVAEVARDTASNMDAAAVSMAESININSINAQTSFENLRKKVGDLAEAIRNAAEGRQGGNDGIYGGGGSTSKGGITTSTHSGSFNTTSAEYTVQIADFDEFQSQLELDIKGYTDAISNIDSQIEILRNLQLTFDNNGGIGGHGYADQIKQLEKDRDKINNALKDDTSSAKSEFSETIDFFERRIEALSDVLSLLDAEIENLNGSFAKNNLVDAELGVTEEKFNNYTDALAMYTQKANEALSKLPSDIARQVKDGAVALTDFIGDGNKDVIEAIKEYESWADKVADCQQNLAGLKKEIRQLEFEKFNNIMDDFNDQVSLRTDSKDLISKQIDLLKEAGELIGDSFYVAQIDQSKKQLELLEKEKAQLMNQMTDAIGSGRVD